MALKEFGKFTLPCETNFVGWEDLRREARPYLGKSKVLGNRLAGARMAMQRLRQQQGHLEYTFFINVLKNPATTVEGVRWALQNLRVVCRERRLAPETKRYVEEVGRRNLNRAHAVADLEFLWERKSMGKLLDQDYSRVRAAVRRRLRLGSLTLKCVGMTPREMERLGFRS